MDNVHPRDTQGPARRRRVRTSGNHISVSIVVPAYNNARDLELCLTALVAQSSVHTEIIVVDDGSTKEIRTVASALGARTVRLDRNSGPSSARNAGARIATGDFLVFVDSDVVIAPGGLNRLVGVLERDSAIAAVFGSYDDQPRAQGIVSQYRNLLHHYVHQTGNPEASTFWGGCGAIRRSVFEQAGGFDEQHFPRCIEDIELGYHLRATGHRIVLDRTIQGTHLKRWTLRSMIRTDVYCRAIPWTRLILERRDVPSDLNLKKGQRASATFVALACIGVLLSVEGLRALALSAIALLAVIAINRNLYAFFIRRRGVLFMCAAVPLHILYFLYAGATYAYVWCERRLKSLTMTLPSKELRLWQPFVRVRRARASARTSRT